MLTNPQRSLVPTRASLRQLLGKLLPTDAELQAFCLDHFPEIAARFTDNMDRLIKLNLLLTCVPADQLLVLLRSTFPDALAHHSNVPLYEAAQDTLDSSPENMHKLRNRLRMLAKVRTFWIAGVLESSLNGLSPIALDKESCSGAGFSTWDAVLYCPPQRYQSIPREKRMLDLFDEHLGELLIVGMPGSGKTTTLLELCRDLLARAELEPGAPIPVVLNLSTWAQKSLPIADWIIDELYHRYDVPRVVGTAWSQARILLPLLDGLDELRLEFRASCVAALNHYLQTAEAPGLVVCCRQADHEALPAPLRLQAAIRLNPLSAEQIARQLELRGVSEEQFRALIGTDSPLRELTHSPLFLDILLRVLHGQTADALLATANAEERRRNLFGAYFQAVTMRRSVPSRYSPPQTLHYLSEIARRLAAQNQSAFYVEDLQPPAQQTRLQKWAYRLGPPTILYLFIGAIYYAFQGISLALRPNQFGVDFSSFPRWMLPVSYAVTSILAIIFSVAQEPLERARTSFEFRWSWSALSAGIQPSLKASIRKGLSSWLICSLCSAMLGLSIIIHRNPQFSSTTRAAVTVLIGLFLIYCITFAVPFALGYFWAELFRKAICYDVLRERQFPNQDNSIAMRRIVILLGCWLAFLTTFSLVSIWCLSSFQTPVLRYGLVLAYMTFSGLLASIIPYVGGLAVARHYTIRVLLARRGLLPFRLVEFLNFAADHLLLRRVGGGYVFIHRLFADYLATLSPDEQQRLSTALVRPTSRQNLNR